MTVLSLLKMKSLVFSIPLSIVSPNPDYFSPLYRAAICSSLNKGDDGPLRHHPAYQLHIVFSWSRKHGRSPSSFSRFLQFTHVHSDIVLFIYCQFQKLYKEFKKFCFYAIKSQKYLIKEMELSDLTWCYFPNFQKKSEGHFSIDLIFCDDSIW